MSSGKKRSWWWNALGTVTFIAVGVGVVAGWMVLHKGHSEAATTPTARLPEAVVVTVEPVTPRPLRRTVQVVGTLFGRDEVTISPKVEGRIIKIHHDVGDAVRPGAVLIELDPTDYELAVMEARRALELALAKIGLKQFPDKTFDITTLPMAVKAAAQERNALARLERIRRLVTSGGTTGEERDQVETEYKVALANQRQAVLEAEATLAEARQRQAALDTALQRLKDTRIVAPASSEETAEYVVCQRDVSEGEIVRPLPMGNTTLLKLIVDRPLKLKVTVPERHRGEVQLGQKAELEVEAFPGQRFSGQVSRINPSVDRANRTFQVEIHVPNQDRKLSAGSFAKVCIITRLEDAGPTVPEEAIVRFAGVTKLFAVQDGKAREAQVRTGLSVDVKESSRTRTWVEVEGDLPVGAVVVTAGQTQLADGTPVRVRDAGRAEGRGER